MAVDFETKVIDLAGGPVDVLADPEIAAAVAAGERLVFLQNVSTDGRVYYAERATEPAPNARGHVLLVGDGVALNYRPGDPVAAWVWTPDAEGFVAITPAATT